MYVDLNVYVEKCNVRISLKRRVVWRFRWFPAERTVMMLSSSKFGLGVLADLGVVARLRRPVTFHVLWATRPEFRATTEAIMVVSAKFCK
jgi:hypothetical protein